MKNLLFGLVATVLFSLVGNAQISRIDFIKNKSHEQVYTEFIKLSGENQKAFWIDKVNQILSEKLPTEHLSLIKNILEGLETSNSEVLLKNANLLAKITPLKDFSDMFENLNDYKFNGKFTDTKAVPQSLIDDLLTVEVFNDNSTSKLCSCHWCGGSDSVGSNCTHTHGGCGFLWMQDCDHCFVCW